MSRKYKIIIGFSKSNSIISYLIRFITGFKYSHTYIRFNLNDVNTNIVAHADKYFVYCENYDLFLKRVEKVKEFYFYCDEDRYNKIINFVFNKCGVKYSYMQIIGILIFLLFNYILKINIKNPFANNDNGYICTEFVSNILDLPNGEENTIYDIYKYCYNNFNVEEGYM